MSQARLGYKLGYYKLAQPNSNPNNVLTLRLELYILGDVKSALKSYIIKFNRTYKLKRLLRSVNDLTFAIRVGGDPNFQTHN